MAPKEGRRPEPAVPQDVTGQGLSQAAWDELKTLSKDNMQSVAQHIEAAYRFLQGDLDAALAHAQTAVRRAGRVAAAREALGTVHYARGEWSEALREFRTATRLSGQPHLLPQMVDCERGLGRPERALALGSSAEAKRLDQAGLIELAIVLSGARRDLGNPRAAALSLRNPAGRVKPDHPSAGRLWFAYAEALEESGDPQAGQWYARATAAGETGGSLPGSSDLEEAVVVDLEESPTDITLSAGRE